MIAVVYLGQKNVLGLEKFWNLVWGQKETGGAENLKSGSSNIGTSTNAMGKLVAEESEEVKNFSSSTVEQKNPKVIPLEKPPFIR